MRVFGVTCRHPGWDDIVTASFVGLALLVAVTALESSGAIETKTARDMMLAGMTAVTLRAYGIDLFRNGLRGLVVFMALVMLAHDAYVMIAGLFAG